ALVVVEVGAGPAHDVVYGGPRDTFPLRDLPVGPIELPGEVQDAALMVGQQRAVEVEEAQLALAASGTVKHLALTVYGSSAFPGALLLVAQHELHQPEHAQHDRRQCDQADRTRDHGEDDEGQSGSSSSTGSTRSSCRICKASAACSRGTQRSTAAISPAVSGMTAAIASWRRKTWMPEASRTAFQTSASGRPLAVTSLVNACEFFSGFIQSPLSAIAHPGTARGRIGSDPRGPPRCRPTSPVRKAQLRY